jgi:hypothetical protein
MNAEIIGFYGFCLVLIVLGLGLKAVLKFHSIFLTIGHTNYADCEALYPLTANH